MNQDAAYERLVARLESMIQERDAIDRELLKPEVLSDPGAVRRLSIQRAALDDLCDRYEAYRRLDEESDQLRTMIQEESDDELVALAEEDLEKVLHRQATLMQAIKGAVVSTADRAVGSVILELRAGVGGDEAGLWVGDLLEMYQRFAALRKWKVESLSMAPGEAGGFRSVVIGISGPGVWSELGHEAGTHQVKRVPATESQGRIHTSTATVAVLPEPEEVELDLDENDVKVMVTTAQGPGGQNVNKVATAVHLIHEPSGIEVRMQESKSQTQNREKAWKLLRARLYERQREEAAKERRDQRLAMIGSASRAEKIRTYRYKDNLVVDHRVGESFNLQAVMAGEMNALAAALVDLEIQRRLEAL